MLTKLGKEHNFDFYTNNNLVELICRAESEYIGDIDLANDDGRLIELSTSNMRANPQLGPAQLTFDSNLDPRIRPGVVLDISKLLTAGTNTEAKSLETSNKILSGKVAGFSRYMALEVQHTGSNWADKWSTIVNALTPKKGTAMSPETWFK